MRPLPALANGAMLDVMFLVSITVIYVAVEARTFGAGFSAFGEEARGAFKVDLDAHCDEVGDRVDVGTFLDDFYVERRWSIR